MSSQYLVLSKTFTAVSGARDDTRFTTSIMMEGRRKRDESSVVQCWMEGQPEREKRERKIEREHERERQREGKKDLVFILL